MQADTPKQLSFWQQPINPLALGGIFLLLGLLCYILWPQMTRIPIMDENIMIYEGFSVANGKTPYRDFFDFIYPGTFYLVALMNKIFGPSLFALRALALFCLGTCIFTTLHLGRRFLPTKWLIFLGALFYIFNFPSSFQVGHHLFSTTAGLLSVWQLSLYVSSFFPENKPQQKYHLILAGLLCGVSFWFTQSMGLCLLVGSLIFLALFLSRMIMTGKTKLIFMFFGLAMTPITLTVLWFIGVGAVNSFFYSTFWWLLEGTYQQTTDSWYFKEGFMKMLNSHWLKVVTLFLQGMLPILGLLWPLDIFYRIQKQKTEYRACDWQLLLLWVSGIAFMIPIFSYPSSIMIAQHAWLPYLLATIILFTLLKKKPHIENIAIFLTLVVLSVYGAQQLQNASILMKSKKLISYGTVEKEIFPPTGSQDDLTMVYRSLIYWIHEHSPPGEELFVYNLAPELYLLTDRQNPTRYNYLMAVYNTPQQIQEAADSLQKKRPKFVVYNNLDWFFFTRDFRFARLRNYDYHLKPIERVLNQDYYLTMKAGALWLYERK